MATVAFACSTCGKQFRVLPEQTGRKVRCPHCEAPNSVPDGVFGRDRGLEEAGPQEAGRIAELSAAFDETRSPGRDPVLPPRSEVRTSNKGMMALILGALGVGTLGVFGVGTLGLLRVGTLSVFGPPTLGVLGVSTLGVLGVATLGLLGIPAIVLGVVATKEIDRSRGTMVGKGMAIWGIVLGALAVVGALSYVAYRLLGATSP